MITGTYKILEIIRYNVRRQCIILLSRFLKQKKKHKIILGKAYDLHEAGPRLSDDSLSPILVYLQCRGF